MFSHPHKEVGLYAVLFQLGYTPIAMATGLAMSFLGPILYQRSGDATDLSRNTYVHRIAWKLTASSLLLTLAAVSSSLFFHDWIFQLLVSEQYRSISYLLPWVLLAGGIFASAQVLSVKLASEMKTLTMTWAKIITAILGTAFNFIGAYIAGILGVVVAIVVFSAVYFTWMARLSFRTPQTPKKTEDSSIYSPSHMN